MTQPRVGIFWLVGRRQVIDSTPLDEAEDYGEFKVHPGGHYAVWDKLRRAGVVPADMEYEEAPRGRVIYNAKTRQFRLLADTCILRDKRSIRSIMAALQLPQNSETASDDHYRCSQCFPGEGAALWTDQEPQQ